MPIATDELGEHWKHRNGRKDCDFCLIAKFVNRRYRTPGHHNGRPRLVFAGREPRSWGVIDYAEIEKFLNLWAPWAPW